MRNARPGKKSRICDWDYFSFNTMLDLGIDIRKSYKNMPVNNKALREDIIRLDQCSSTVLFRQKAILECLTRKGVLIKEEFVKTERKLVREALKEK